MIFFSREILELANCVWYKESQQIEKPEGRFAAQPAVTKKNTIKQHAGGNSNLHVHTPVQVEAESRGSVSHLKPAYAQWAAWSIQD